jgi:DNA-binding HxlR family transcriptional regulator
MAEDFDAAALDDVIHGKLRLAIMAYLSAVESATFNEIKARTSASDGNLSVHLRKLEEASYVWIDKRFVDRKPQTRAGLTTVGRDAWIAYLDQLRTLLGGD